MSAVGDFIKGVSRQLNDQRQGREFTRWTRADMLGYVNDGLKAIEGYRPDAFVAEVVIPLTTGSLQRTENKGIISIQVDGTTLASESSFELLKAYAGVCPVEVRFDSAGNPVYAIEAIAVDPKNPNQFYVSPPVPQGITTSVTASVYGVPPEYTAADWFNPLVISSKYVNSLIDYIKGRCLEVNTESATSMRAASVYMQRFYSVMGVTYKMESLHKSGYYLGKLGDGDPQAGRR